MKKLPYILLIALFSCVSVRKVSDFHSLQGRLVSVKWHPRVKMVKSATLIFEPVLKKDTCMIEFRYRDNSRTGHPRFRIGDVYTLTYDSSKIKAGDTAVMATIKRNF